MTTDAGTAEDSKETWLYPDGADFKRRSSGNDKEFTEVPTAVSTSVNPIMGLFNYLKGLMTVLGDFIGAMYPDPGNMPGGDPYGDDEEEEGDAAHSEDNKGHSGQYDKLKQDNN